MNNGDSFKTSDDNYSSFFFKVNHSISFIKTCDSFIKATDSDSFKVNHSNSFIETIVILLLWSLR